MVQAMDEIARVQAPPFDRRRGELLISTDPALLDVDAVERFLRASYWAPDRPREVIVRSLARSLSFGLYRALGAAAGAVEQRQVGYARVVTDRATFAWLCDVFLEESVRGEGLGTWLIETVLEHPDLQGLRRTMLATRDAHALYARFGFEALSEPGRYMELVRRDQPSKEVPEA